MAFDPNASAARKRMPIFDGCMMYFPDALLAVAAFSLKANDKHNPGEPLHWSKHKSYDHANCVGRHLIDIGPNWDAIDPEFDEMHAVALAWRALAVLQIAIEAKRAGMTVRAYLEKLKREAESAEKKPFDPSILLNPFPEMVWYRGVEPRTVQVDSTGSVLLMNKHGQVTNTYGNIEQLLKDTGEAGQYTFEPQ